MQACIYEEYGPPEVVRVAEVARPVPRPDEVLVRVHAASVTTADWRFRTATFPRIFWLIGRLMVGLFRPRNPVLGMDFSGVVESVGSRVSRFRAGDRVFGAASRGAHADYVTVPEAGAITVKPESLTHEEAAAIPFGANCALAFLRDIARIRPGQKVLVIGASGGVGIWAVQVARHLGAVVTGVCSASNLELVRSVGAHHVIDYTAGPIFRDGDQYDVVFDTVGKTSFTECKPALTPTGLFLPLENELREILQATRTAWSSGKRVKFAISQNTRAGLEEIVGLIAAGEARPIIDHVYPMAEIAEAHRRVDGRHKRGSVIVRMR